MGQVLKLVDFIEKYNQKQINLTDYFSLNELSRIYKFKFKLNISNKLLVRILNLDNISIIDVIIKLGQEISNKKNTKFIKKLKVKVLKVGDEIYLN